jgi:hypothetical protein
MALTLPAIASARTVEGVEPSRLPKREQAMADKSPRQHMSKKAGKSLKEKRADKQAKADKLNQHIEIVPSKKR